jgi:two-component system, OmpR family, phosphate regulon sensor histidine kinase PhoR
VGRRIIWQLYPPFILLIVAALFVVVWYASSSMRSLYRERTSADLYSRAVLIEQLAHDLLVQNRNEELDSLVKIVGPESETRITVILPSGEVIADSDEDVALMDNHADRPEVRSALGAAQGVSSRFSNTLQMNMMYVAIPMMSGDTTKAVLRTSIPVKLVDETLTTLGNQIAVGGLIVVVLAAMISLVITRRISRPIERLRLGAERFAEGDLSYQLAIPNTEEMGGLAQSMNKMAAQLDDRLRMVLRQRNEIQGILSSMVEGVLAVDPAGRLLNLNEAAAQMLQIDIEQVRKRSVQEVIANEQLRDLINHVLASREPVEGAITLGETEERFVQGHGTLLIDPQGNSIGAVVVLNDITRLRRLETVRREFVANVSHELKTPITAIKGFVETLLDGALDNPEDARRFLTIVADKVDHMTDIIEDLLALSRIEQNVDKEQIRLERGNIHEVLSSAMDTCYGKAKESGVELVMECPEDLYAQINNPLLEQGVVNLIDNAIKFSGVDDKVNIEARAVDGSIVISVTDQGAGIPPEHLPRLFERFYRVDKGRSRQMGGSGLGLAITKHIALAHGGEISVKSTLGTGSKFSITIPHIVETPAGGGALS